MKHCLCVVKTETEGNKNETRKPVDLKLSPLKTSSLAAIQECTEIANTHPNKCTHPTTDIRVG